MQFLSIKKDARYFQIIFQLIFLLYGVLFLHWNAQWWLYSTYFGISIVTQFTCELIFKKTTEKKLSAAWWKIFKAGIPSAIISSLGLSLLLKTNLFYVAVFAAVVSILSKYLLRIKNKHIFNPSALGIVAAIFFTEKAWISPGQWGSGAVLLFTVLILGFIINTKVQKLEVSIAFLASFGGLLFFRQIIYLGWPMDFFVHSVSTGSLLLFSFFMITDPKTTPNHKLVRIVWCIAIGAIAFYLATFKFMNGAPVFVLVLAQPLVPLLDYLFKAKKFEWKPSNIYLPREQQFLQHIYNNTSI
jgi:Na+-transporting NADH:ubiquinone oxidoreductase subunit NqrB